MDKKRLREALDDIRSDLASAQSLDIESEFLDSERVKKLFWAIEEALTHVKALQESLEC